MYGKTLRKIHSTEPYFIDTVSSVLPEKIKFNEAEIYCEIGNSVYDNSLWIRARASNSKWFIKLNQYEHVSSVNASKLGSSHTNYLSAIDFSCFDVVVEAINNCLRSFQHTTYWHITNRSLTGYQQTANCWLMVGRHFSLQHWKNCWPTVGGQTADSISWELLFTFTDVCR